VCKGKSSDAITAHPTDTNVESLIEHLQMKSSQEISHQRNAKTELKMAEVIKEWELVPILPYQPS